MHRTAGLCVVNKVRRILQPDVRLISHLKLVLFDNKGTGSLKSCNSARIFVAWHFNVVTSSVFIK